eukprot:6632888-Pyramimonas_sp.AAC.1
MRPVRELATRVAVAAFHWRMACARLIIVLDLGCCQTPDAREFPPSSVRFLGARRTPQRLLLACASSSS